MREQKSPDQRGNGNSKILFRCQTPAFALIGSEDETISPTPLSKEEKQHIQCVSKDIENARLKKTFEDAMEKQLAFSKHGEEK